MHQVVKAVGVVARAAATSTPRVGVRALHSSAPSSAFSKFAMPAMSPTMTEGGLATWKVQEGSAFSAGDVLLEIETDKATMDVEAQDDGVLAKIVVQAGEKGVQVGRMIAILAEEGDDLSQAESQVKADEPASAPKETPPPKQERQSSSSPSSSSSSQPQAGHTPSAPKPSGSTGHAGDSISQMFPSVSRLLAENNISAEQASGIKGTGIRGMLTKGDILMHLGKVSSPTGSYKRGHAGVTAFGGAPPAGKGPAVKSSGEKGDKVTPSKPLSSIQLRSAILSGLASSSSSARRTSPPPAPKPQSPETFKEVISGYSPPSAVSSSKATSVPKKDWLDGLI
ncbi:unnamed protein product [Sympodiomycopsis kandeliae]